MVFIIYEFFNLLLFGGIFGHVDANTFTKLGDLDTADILTPQFKNIQKINSALCRPSTYNYGTITLFTTFYNNKEKFYIFNNTITIWSQLLPFATPLLFITNDGSLFDLSLTYLVKRACSLNWIVMSVPASENSTYPVLKDMFLQAYQTTTTKWYGYANGDILFDDSLIYSLKIADKYSSTILPYSLIVGQRYDIELDFNEALDSKEKIKHLLLNATLHASYGIDYFITPRYGFPWKKFPPLVIGRPEVDNFLLWFAEQLSPSVIDIDATDSIMALHQSTRNIEQGWKTMHEYVYHNRNLTSNFTIGDKTYDKYYGKTECVSYKLGHWHSPYTRLYKRIMLHRPKCQTIKLIPVPEDKP